MAHTLKSDKDKARYRNRKGELTTNVLAAFTRDMQFTHVLPGWEGWAHDNRVLCDAFSRKNSLKIPQGDESHDNFCVN